MPADRLEKAGSSARSCRQRIKGRTEGVAADSEPHGGPTRFLETMDGEHAGGLSAPRGAFLPVAHNAAGRACGGFTVLDRTLSDRSVDRAYPAILASASGGMAASLNLPQVTRKGGLTKET